jgi:hypothetical protein
MRTILRVIAEIKQFWFEFHPQTFTHLIAHRASLSIAITLAALTSLMSFATRAESPSELKQIYRCVGLDEDTHFDSVEIRTTERPQIFQGVAHYLDLNGEWVEKSAPLFRSERQTNDGRMIYFGSSLLQVRIFPAKILSEEKMRATISMSELGLEFIEAACKPAATSPLSP